MKSHQIIADALSEWRSVASAADLAHETFDQLDDDELRRLATRGYTEEVRAALRRTASMTDLQEPMGLGAVVEDGDGVRWVRTDTGEPAVPYPWSTPAVQAGWDGIAAVRVLSKGLPA